ncbi:MAG: TIM44-like domain-containing protein [Gammaproteobacteria bacterium]|nr:TIM44-like domain-containing protein [Gammaproteobacteria bacterium]
MKPFIAMLAIIFAIFTTMPDAEARKFGGKRSFGKSQPTQTQQKQTTTDQKKQSATQKSSKKGLLGGMLGGLLVGGLIASMMGGAFEGFQMMDFVIMAGLAFVLFKLFKMFNQSKARAQQPAYAANQSQNQFKQQVDTPINPAPGNSGGFATSTEQVPFNLPADFDLNGFLEGSRSHYKTLQQAWNDNDLEKIQEYVSNEMFNELNQQRRELENTPNTEVMFLDAELVRAEHTEKLAEVSVKFSGRYRDTNENLEEDICEVWHLERQLEQTDAPWLIVGIENKD